MYRYIGQCDRLRRTSYGEKAWQEMMRNKKRIRLRFFLRLVDMHPLLDSDETVSDYMSTHSDARAYASTWDGKLCLFLQHSGFEFIFMRKGRK